MQSPILLTGFEPFDGAALNPSGEVARVLDGRRIGAHRVVARQLPCVCAQAVAELDAAIDALRPALVIALGLAGSRSAVSVERVAINLIDARIPDNAGAQPVDVPVVPGAPAAYFARVPVKAMVAAVRDAGLPVELSCSAGTYVCNQVFYGLLHRLQRLPGVRGGFIHLPPLPDQAERFAPSRPLALAEQVRAVEAALHAALRDGPDLDRSEGRID